MECHNCKTSQLIKRLRGRFGDDIPTELKAPIYDSCLCCSHSCQNCRTSVPVPSKDGKKKPVFKSVYERKRALEKAILRNSRMERPKLSISDIPEADDLAGRANRAEAAPSEAPRIVSTDPEAVADAKRELAMLIRTHCHTCSQSQDDNPSHRGITFVSKDSDSASEDPNTQLEDWLLAQKETDATDIYRDGCTGLPADIENLLRVQLSEFSQLSVYDKLLVCVLMTRKTGYANRFYTLADFGKNRWLDADVLAKIRDGISKQAAHVRYGNIVRKIPILSAIAHGQIGKGKGGAKKLRMTDLDEEQTDFIDLLFEGENAPPAEEEREQPADEREQPDPSRPVAFAPNHTTAIRSSADSVDPDPEND